MRPCAYQTLSYRAPWKTGRCSSPEYWAWTPARLPRARCRSTCLGNHMAPTGAGSTLLKQPPLPAALKVQRHFQISCPCCSCRTQTKPLHSLIRLLCFFSPPYVFSSFPAPVTWNIIALSKRDVVHYKLVQQHSDTEYLDDFNLK